MYPELSAKTALVTGGGTGIGFGCAYQLCRHGVKVMLAGRREEILAAAQKKLLEQLPDAKVSFRVCDATSEEDMAATVAAAAADGKGLDIMVANAGSAVPGPILELKAEDWRATADMNILTTALSLKYAGRSMREHGNRGCIITVSSTGAVQTEKWMATYSSTKAGVEMLTRCAAVELAPFGIRVNCIQPGYVVTEATEMAFSESLEQQLMQMTPLGQPGQPDDIGQALLYLVADSGRWVTGQIMGVDGGLSVFQGASFDELARMIYGDETIDRCSGPTESQQ